MTLNSPSQATRGARLLPLILLAAACLAGSLSACGSGSASTTASGASAGSARAPGSTSTSVPSSGANKASEGRAGAGSAASGARQSGEAGSANPPPLTRASARRAEGRAEARKAVRHRTLARKAGNAAPFLVPVGDNSIPTYGSEAPSSEQAAATASLGAYLNARASGDWGGACAHMAATVQKQLEALAGAPGAKAEGCAGAYAKLSSRVPASERASPLSGAIAAFRVEGEKAFALFYGPHEQQYMMPMVSEGGVWKANQIEPIPWPIGAPTASP